MHRLRDVQCRFLSSWWGWPSWTCRSDTMVIYCLHTQCCWHSSGLQCSVINDWNETHCPDGCSWRGVHKVLWSCTSCTDTLFWFLSWIKSQLLLFMQLRLQTVSVLTASSIVAYMLTLCTLTCYKVRCCAYISSGWSLTCHICVTTPNQVNTQSSMGFWHMSTCYAKPVASDLY